VSTFAPVCVGLLILAAIADAMSLDMSLGSSIVEDSLSEHDACSLKPPSTLSLNVEAHLRCAL
jgi:hypothetical protein